MAALVREPPERAAGLERRLDPPVVGRPPESRPEVVALVIEAIEPRLLRRAQELRLGLDRKRQEVILVAASDRVGFVALGELLEPVLPNRLEHLEARLAVLRLDGGGQASAARARWAVTAPAIAPRALEKATKNESPSVATSTPPGASNANRRMAWCRSRTAVNALPRAATRRVEPSLSVNRNVTVPVGSAGRDRSRCCVTTEDTVALRRELRRFLDRVLWRVQ